MQARWSSTPKAHTLSKCQSLHFRVSSSIIVAKAHSAKVLKCLKIEHELACCSDSRAAASLSVPAPGATAAAGADSGAAQDIHGNIQCHRDGTLSFGTVPTLSWLWQSTLAVRSASAYVCIMKQHNILFMRQRVPALPY